MLLAVDIGNSQSSFGVFEGKKLLHHFRNHSRSTHTEEEYLAFLSPCLSHNGLSIKDISEVAVCSVVPPAEENFQRFCQKYLKRTPFVVSSEVSLGFSINVETPREVGADRLANAAYAIKHLELPAVVIDLGTATTFDVCKPGPSYEGGVILPGLHMAFESLSVKTAKLPLVEAEFPKSVIGKTTAECIQAGILFGYCDLIDGLLDRTMKELGGRVSIALTGGLSHLFHKRIRHESVCLPDLTLEGIRVLLEED